MVVLGLPALVRLRIVSLCHSFLIYVNEYNVTQIDHRRFLRQLEKLGQVKLVCSSVVLQQPNTILRNKRMRIRVVLVLSFAFYGFLFSPSVLVIVSLTVLFICSAMLAATLLLCVHEKKVSPVTRKTTTTEIV